MNFQIYEEATEWVVKHREGGLDSHEKKSFDMWLRASPQHVRAYLEMSAVWEDLPSLDPGRNLHADELIARARADENVMLFASSSRLPGRPVSTAEVPDDRLHTTEGPALASLHREPVLTGGQASSQSPHLKAKSASASQTRTRAIYALAASFLIAIGGGWKYFQRGVYATGVGEQRSLVLADGSIVELNSRSRIKVQYAEHERRIDLLEGQALFHVAKNNSRPFIVEAGNAQVRAVGTAFDVYKMDSDTIVTVVEGRVAVHAQQPTGAASVSHGDGRRTAGSSEERITNAAASPTTGVTRQRAEKVDSVRETEDTSSSSGRTSGSAGPVLSGIEAAAGEILLAAGEQLVVTPRAVTSPKNANIAAATAWTRRNLVFDSAPLTDVAQEFNRYNTRRVVIEDPQLAEFHVSGVFSSVEPTLLLRFLKTQPELAVEETDTEIRIRRK